MTNGTTPETPLSILLVEQDINWGRFFQSYLEHKGFEVSLSTDGLDAWQRIVKGQHNFCILNPEITSMDGCSLAEHIREQAGNIPVVFVASDKQDSETMRLNCFRAGADDFIVRPCSLEEILWRIKTINRRFQFRPLADGKVFDLGKLRFDHAQQRLFGHDCNIRLTTKEAELLLALCLNRGKVLERDRALMAVWKSTDHYNVRSMDVYISKLRRLLFQYTYSEILNIHGVGFKLLTHRDAGFRQVLRRDAGLLRKRTVRNIRKEALAMGTAENHIIPVMREPDAQKAYDRTVEAVTEPVAGEEASAKAVADGVAVDGMSMAEAVVEKALAIGESINGQTADGVAVAGAQPETSVPPASSASVSATSV